MDDAEIVDRGACQAEAWHGERGSGILPACQPIANLEIAIGAGFVDEGGGHRETIDHGGHVHDDDFHHLSWGGHIHRKLRGAGFTVGLAFVSGRIF